MTYNPNIPQPNDRPAQSQGQILTNFTQLNTIFDENHVTFNNVTVADRGKHKFVVIKRNGGDPTTAGTDTALYTKSSSGTSQLFWRFQGDGSVVRITNSIPPFAVQNGYTWLPGGMMLQWGTANVNQDGTGNIVFPTPFSGVPYVVLPVIQRSIGSVNAVVACVRTGTITANGFGTLLLPISPADIRTIYWAAIGPST